MSDAHRAALLRLAAERGEKGFSRLVAEAVDAYLASRRASDRAGVQRLKGVLPASEAEAFRRRIDAIRTRWR
jgi:hypothetical protein